MLSPNESFLSTIEAEVPNKSTPLLISCKTGGRSMKASQILVDAGYTDVTNVQGGYDAWSSAGLPIEK